MTDQKLIAGIFNDFLGLYTGKIQTVFIFFNQRTDTGLNFARIKS